MPLTDLCTAFTLLTRLPVTRFSHAGAQPDLARCVWAFPIVGLAVGGFGGAMYWAAHMLGLAPLVAASWAMAAALLVTGALHDDGLADTADGFGGGATPDRKLEIMRDSRIGAFGALALLLSVIVRIGCVAALDEPRRVVPAMIAAGMLGRGGMLALLWLARPARPDSLAASLGAVPRGRLMTGLAIALGGSFLTLPNVTAVGAVILAIGVSLAMAKVSLAQVGGYTGDVLGAVEVITECMVLTAAAGALAG